LAKLLKKRSFAAVILVVVVVLSLFLGTNVSISRNVKRLDNMFTNGMKSSDGSYTKPSILSQCDASMDYAMGFYTFTVKYADDDELIMLSERLKQARESYLSYRKLVNPGIPMQTPYATSYYAVYESAQNLYSALHSRVAFTISDAEAIGAYFGDLQGANELIKELAAEYNHEVAAAALPARIFCIGRSGFNLHHSAFPVVMEITWKENSWSAAW